ncbi:cysteine synthase family protein, partial [Patescibacteria group bacterium]|nr:cysteine synthase family protein [Patescibacteria group bacterium]
MKKQITKITNLIGNTPLIEFDLDLGGSTVLAKLESYNLTGSVKDRMAQFMMQRAQEKGLLKKNTTIVEATTGNTGIALAALSAIYGYKLIVVMPEDVSKERAEMLKLYGARVILTSKKKGPLGAIKKRDYLAKQIVGSWIPGQFSNPDNVEAHAKGIAKEILEQAGGKVDYFVHGIGTGGTLIGIAKVLKQNYPKIKIIAVEPEESAVFGGGKPGFHGIQGIGEGFIPSLVNKKYIDGVVSVSTKEALKETRVLVSKHGLLVGISSGANISAIKKLKKTVN